jgi:hypothetical protein
MSALKRASNALHDRSWLKATPGPDNYTLRRVAEIAALTCGFEHRMLQKKIIYDAWRPGRLLTTRIADSGNKFNDFVCSRQAAADWLYTQRVALPAELFDITPTRLY